MNNDKEITKVLQEKSGIRLDIGCGYNKQPGFVGLDIQPLDGVDIVHDWLSFPWPLPDESVIQAIASHVVEHIPRVMYINGQSRWTFIDFMNEVWRVLKPGSQFAIAMPYCISPGYFQDPTHVNPCNERTWLYFDPTAQDGLFYNFYKPKPWKLEYISWDVVTNMEVLLSKVEEK
jgi:SAM-dependent methyltransferase